MDLRTPPHRRTLQRMFWAACAYCVIAGVSISGVALSGIGFTGEGSPPAGTLGAQVVVFPPLGQPLPPLDPPPAPPQPEGIIGLESTSANAGDIVQIVVTATSCVTESIQLNLIWDDPQVLSFIGWQPGAALESYAAETEDCDVFIYPLADGLLLTDLEFYETAFNSDVHGSELLILEFATTTEVSGPRLMLLLDQWGGFSAADIQILPSILVKKGDVNDDQVIDFADPLLLLDHIFGPATLLCPRAADTDGNDALDLADAVYLLNYLFSSVSEPLSGICEPTAESDPLPCSPSGCEG